VLEVLADLAKNSWGNLKDLNGTEIGDDEKKLMNGLVINY
jgi:hypothetical protein